MLTRSQAQQPTLFVARLVPSSLPLSMQATAAGRFEPFCRDRLLRALRRCRRASAAWRE
jgi:hypothetical protein